MKKIITIFAMAVSLQIMAGTNADNLNIDPQFLKIKVYKLLVSESPLCANPVTIFQDSNPTYQDVLESPTLGSGLITDGTYPCIILEISDNIKFAPDSNSYGSNGTDANCSAGVEEILDVCRTGSSSTMTNGNSVSCDNTEQKVTMWLSTTSTSNTGDAFTPPTQLNDGSNGLPLGSSLNVSGTSTGKFVVNGSEKICDGLDDNCDEIECGMMPPAFSFEKI